MKILVLFKKNILMLFICLFIIGLFLYNRSQDKSKLIDNELQTLYNLPSTYTIEESIIDGFVNVTGICDKPNKKITNFLKKVNHKSWATLKTVKSINEELKITLYIFDDRIGEIRTWTYEVNMQRGQSPDRRFKSAYLKINEIGVLSVYLENIKSSIHPIQSEKLKDEVLYSFYN